MGYRFVEGLAVADIAFEATGPDLAALLASAAEAVTATMVKDPATIRGQEERALEVSAPDAERLLHKFLEEVVYLKDAELLLLARFDVRVEEAGGVLRATATARGERLDARRHEQVVDVKAVTWHRFEVRRGPRGWAATVVLDI